MTSKVSASPPSSPPRLLQSPVMSATHLAFVSGGDIWVAPRAGGMDGGPDNPLGARALYLYQNGRDTLYRIHGTNEPETIGRSAFSGCIRMRNIDVIDLFNRVPNGTKVIVT